jgi:chemotaxis protein CheD
MTRTRLRPATGLKRIVIHQGETHVSADPGEVLTTVLGSCVAACLHDPVARIGGINHFLLAEPAVADTDPGPLQRYGAHAMDWLIRALLAMGATRANLKARLYGGASLSDGLGDIGAANLRFARRFLRAEGILLVGEDVGGSGARRVEFRPALGLARCRTASERPAPSLIPLAPARRLPELLS